MQETPPPVEIDTSTTCTEIFTPQNTITNEVMAKYLSSVLNVKRKSGSDYNANDIERVTGIKQRHYCTEIGAPPLDRRRIVPEMALEVALNVLAKKRDFDRVDDLFVSTSFPFGTSLSHELAESLRARGKRVSRPRQDVYAECTSPVWILNYIRENNQEYDGKNILIVSSEYVSPISDDINTTLPSDAATAIAFKNGVDLKIRGSVVHYYPELRHLIRVSIMPEHEPPEGSLFFCDIEQPSSSKQLYGEEKYGFDLRYGEMDGPGVFAWVANPNTLPPIIDETCEMAKVNRDEIDLVIPHQANGRMLDNLGSIIGIDQDKIFSNIRNHGNTGSASTILAWYEAERDGLIRKNSKVLVLNFGAGMMAGAALVEA